jgi:putative zinc finger/helix-turn-helix YgiT family protein
MEEEIMKALKCPECGANMKTSRENFRHAALGLPGLTLFDVEVSRCPACGEYEVEIPHLEGLIKAIAGELIAKPARLAPEEIAFLRKSMGLSSDDLAKRMGVSKEQVSRWESGKKPMGAVADRLLRMLVATTKPIEDYSAESLEKIKAETSAPMKLRMQRGRKEWQLAAA